MDVSPLHIRVTIDALVLRGFAPEQRQALTAGLQAELRRLLSDPENAAALGGSRAIARLPASKLQVDAKTSPRRMGALAARQVARMVRS